MNYYTMKEVETHNIFNDTVWIVISDNVYDITSYIERDLHPGGNDVFQKYAGSDATKRFSELHSTNAWSELEQFKIGYLKQSDSLITKIYNTIPKLF